MSNLRAYGISFILCILMGCGYRWSCEKDVLPTVSVAFAKGDEDGLFTAELIRTLGTSPRLNVVSQEGDYRLEVTLLGQTNETIGYRIDPQQTSGKTQKNIVADEGRRLIAVEVVLIECLENKAIFGPCRIQADTDYDYVDGDSYQDLTFVDAFGVKQTVLAFSLGQLESVEAAQEAASRALYQKLCQKIVDCISVQW